MKKSALRFSFIGCLAIWFKSQIAMILKNTSVFWIGPRFSKYLRSFKTYIDHVYIHKHFFCCLLNECISCNSGYFLVDSQCLPICPSGTYANNLNNQCESCSSDCNTCSYEFDYCTSCLENFSLDYLNFCYSECTAGKLPSTCEPC